MDGKSDRDETPRDESTAGVTGETAEEPVTPDSKSLREEMDELYERYGDAFRRLQ